MGKIKRDIPATWERRRLTVEVPMNYPGAVISVNHCYRPNGRGGRVLEPEAKRWRDALATALTYAFLAHGVRIAAFEEPVTVGIDARYLDEKHGTDPDNLRKLTNDAVKDCLGVDDRRYQPRPGKVEYDPGRTPSITVTVEATVVVDEA